ncbi:MAG TPA: polysaccharide biosynthesis/export family protein [Opitutaceae bacterium]|nr:polysaccharide biosynthesis/export family protein [Opitutaceae bacterium]
MTFRFLRLCVLCAFAIPLLSAQAQTTDNATPPPPDSSVTPAVPDVATDPDHILHPQDVLRVEIFEEDEINQQCQWLEVSSGSTLTLPLIGTISVKGKTIREARELIRSLYNKDYIVNPQVNVVVLKYADRSVDVLGSVTNQGRVKFPENRDLTIVDAIALAGGQTRLADLKRVRLTRRNDKGEPETTEINVDAMMRKSGADSVTLQPGDIVYVPERVL